ncbi:hypothetical protein DFJ74DRAFT_651008 [Hyaloraphidium curvatum]|nr:hypothetical protein DFJ74DRAFT_651008 [Hyaloraphidium curvatum]
MKVPCRVFGRARTSILNYAICLGLGLFLLRPWVSHVAPVRSFSPALESLSRGDRFVLVFPVVAKDIAKMETILDTYGAVGQPCSGRFTAVTDFYFLYNLIQDGTVDALNRKLAQSSSFRKMSRCFHETGVVFANLSGIEDEYPAGPSNMFFKLIESPDLKWFRNALYIEATLPTSYNGLEPDYWMKGSVYRGRGFDQAVLYRENWNWVDHLNGNAFYRLNDPEFEDFVRITKEYEPPNDYWKPFDIAMM